MNGYDHETYNLEKEKKSVARQGFLERSLGSRGRIKTIHIHSFFSEDLKIQIHNNIIVYLRTIIYSD